MYLRWPSWVKNGYGGRSTGTSVVPQIADDFGAPRKSAEVGQQETLRPFRIVMLCSFVANAGETMNFHTGEGTE
jgi:hypothetical protein